MAGCASPGNIARVVLVCAMVGAAMHGDAQSALGVAASPSAPDDMAAIATRLAERHLLIPVEGVLPNQLRDTFAEPRGNSAHEAIDIPARRGTPVVATDHGRVVKLVTSIPGGLTVYQVDRDQKVMYYYAHLDAYAPGLREGDLVQRGDVLGVVGSTGNASASAPHLHFAILRLPPGKEWWKGTAINPFPLLRGTAR